MLAHDHALVDLGAGADEELAAIFRALEGIEGGCSFFKRDQHAIATGFEIPLHAAIVEEGMAHNPFAAGRANKLTTEADQAPGGHHEFQQGAVIAGGFHVLHLALADAEFLNTAAHRFFGHIHHQHFEGLAGGAIDRAEDHLGLGHLELVALAAHRFNQDAQVQFAPATHREAVRGIGVLNP